MLYLKIDNSKSYRRILIKFSGYVLPWRRSALSECSCLVCIRQMLGASVSIDLVLTKVLKGFRHNHCR